MEFKEIFNLVNHSKLIRPKLWKTETTFDHLIVTKTTAGQMQLIAVHKNGSWQAVHNIGYFAKFDNWEVLDV